MTMVNAKGDMERRIDQDEWNKKRGHRDNAIDDNNFIIVERTVLRRKHRSSSRHGLPIITLRVESKPMQSILIIPSQTY